MNADARFGDDGVLIIVDVQNDFCPGGALAVPRGDEIIPIVNGLAARFRNVVLTQDWHPLGHSSFASSHRGKKPFDTVTTEYGAQVLWPDHCVQDTPGAEFHPALRAPHAALIVRKGFRRAIDSYSAFFENDGKTPTGLTGYLRERGLNRLFLAGLAFDFLRALLGRRCAAPGIRCVRGRGCLPWHRRRRFGGFDAPGPRGDRGTLHQDPGIRLIRPTLGRFSATLCGDATQLCAMHKKS
jgi:nicotinamidase/pyrazinamidase